MKLSFALLRVSAPLRETFSLALGVLVLMLGAGVFGFAVLRAAGALPAAQAQSGVNCSAAYRVDETLPTGARWELCWEQRALEGIVLYDVTYTPPGGPRRLVIAQASVAQIHVPYDDNGARFHDVTDYGLGNQFLLDLSPEECPGGALLKHGAKDALCKQVKPRGYAQKWYERNLQGYELSLFSVSVSGDYNYIPEWHFYDDGTIAPQMGAAGKLQRYGTNTLYGWRTSATRVPISHIHNYYYRLDFDIDGLANDLVEEIEFNPASANRQRTISVAPLAVEAARPHRPDLMRSWRVRDKVTANAEGHAISYHLEAMSSGHDYIGPDFEPFTHNDLYVTVARTCERFTSHNPTTGGCGADVTQFVNGENSDGTDVVVWYGITFHHLPRDEDETHMDAHWDGFTIVPRDWSASNPLDSRTNGNTPVAGTPTNTPTNTPTGTPTNTPTNTPTQTPTATPTGEPGACSDLLVNGGFESGAAWSFGATPYPAAYVSAPWPVFAGSRAVRSGIPAGTANRAAYSSAYQRVTIPAGAPRVLLRYWERPAGGSDGVDYREVQVLNTSYGMLRLLDRDRAAGADAWRQREFDLTAFAGRAVVLYFNTYNNGASSQAWTTFDDVQLLVCNAPAAEFQNPADALTINPAALVIVAAPGVTGAAVTVDNARAGQPLDWLAATEAPFLALSPAAGQTPGTLEVGLIKDGWQDGEVYTGTVTVASAAAPDVVASLAVTVYAGGGQVFLPLVGGS